MARTSSRWVQRRIEEKENLLNAQEVPPWHGEAEPARPQRHQARRRRRRHIGKPPHAPAPDLAKGKAKRLETKIEVAMAEIQGIGGDGAEGVEGAIDQISRTGRSAIARSTDCYPSRWLTPAQAVGIEHGGGGATQSPELGQEEEVRGHDEHPVGLTEPPGRVRPGRPAPIGGPSPTGGPG
jgi:hypothetical protein